MNYLERIRGLRNDRDLSQKTVAELLHVGQKTYSDYEKGKTRIPLDSMIILARFYDVDMNYICGVSNERRKFPQK
ncbi:helix-turn-helix domain-containing protein [Candidatus Soleaferrea massiliensis]|uniref:helix-turn-helix domain-containing protein n=1 Tax=Candidatus Soleaferrea massiliensis TaxID=1470354 RepID=UPI00059024C2|nr:helix-turn-helix transcriptional regulator [Candidatus Soleaferrea massiliensis]